MSVGVAEEERVGVGVEQRVKCPHCDREYKPGYIGAHIRRKHNTFGGQSGRVRSRKKRPATNDHQAVEVLQVPKIPNPKFKVLPFIVLEDQDGNMWLAERMER